MESQKRKIKLLEKSLDGLKNDARYWHLRRTYGDYSVEVLLHLRQCKIVQGKNGNHT